MHVSRRALMLGLAAAPLAACSTDHELGAQIDEGGFGNPTAHNILVQTGQLPFVIDLAERFAAEVPDTVYFAFGSARLDGAAEAVLRRQADWIRQFPEVTFRVFGHTDLVGSEAYNRRLGLQRARTVVAFLVRNGVSRSRLEAVISEGETQPVIQTPDRERRNRRAVTVVSGFLQNHPMITNGQYAAVVHREYVESATAPRPTGYR
ncbi:MAG: OmpA family protein [Pararhodobacter sp.]